MDENTTTEEIINLTKDLVRFKTMHKNMDQIHDCINFIGEYLNQNEIDFHRYKINGYPALIVTPEFVTLGKKKFTWLLMSHIDVVDAPEKLFEPNVKNGKLFGRGSYDDKYAVALSLVLLKQRLSRLKKQGKSQSDLGFGVLITSDEEIGGSNGAKAILADIQPDFTIVLDGGNVNEIITKEKGIARVSMISKGKTCHASRPWLGRNAIEILMNDYQTLKKYFEKQAPNHWNMTVNPGKIQGGDVINQVPDHCEMVLDIRYTEDEDIEAFITMISKQLESDLVVHGIEPVFISSPSPFLDQIVKLAMEIKMECEHGASDARHLMPYGLTGVVWGANGNLSHHSIDEHVEIESVSTLYRRLYQLLDRSRDFFS